MSETATEIVNCLTCQRGKAGWFKNGDKFKCSCCGGDPLVAGSGRPDWDAFGRAEMSFMFGCRREGDSENLEKYRRELLDKWIYRKDV